MKKIQIRPPHDPAGYWGKGPCDDPAPLRRACVRCDLVPTSGWLERRDEGWVCQKCREAELAAHGHVPVELGPAPPNILLICEGCPEPASA